MNVRMFYHSVLSDWNHGNAHFLRGIASELVERGHAVTIFEPANGWSLSNLLKEHGPEPVERFHAIYPRLQSCRYRLEAIDLDEALDGADLVLVHEWNDPGLVRLIGQHRATHGGYRLLFHDTHHRLVTAREAMAAYDLRHFDGVLAYGAILSRLYRSVGLAEQVWTWHEAADTRVFHPRDEEKTGDVVWVGNWGDDERTAELEEFLINPVRELGLKARVYGVRYPDHAKAALARAGIEYAGWLPNFEVPEVFSRFRLTIHVPRRPYVAALPGIPTIRPFEALACGIPLVCSPWEDTEGLFRPGRDYLVVRDGAEMKNELERLLGDPAARAELAANGLETIRSRHTCAHRIDELLQILN